MAKSILLLGAATAAGLACVPAMAQDFPPGAMAAAPCAATCQGGYPGNAYVGGGYAQGGYAAQAYAPAQPMPAPMVAGGVASYVSQTSAVDYHAYEARYFASRRSQGALHHTTDGAGFLSWAGKTTDFVADGDGLPPQPPAPGPEASGCGGMAGVRVLSCQYIPFTQPAVEQPLAINDADFAYEGGVGPIGVSGGGGGGGGIIEGRGLGLGFGFGRGEGIGRASASASAYASASASTNISISGHFGGHGGHGGGCGRRK
ncbi:MAG: hypothetical protein JO303_05085 [Caulobacteraceae bacterium]|nr:hypothetical protein [Caulobacteraceae bacterium]